MKVAKSAGYALHALMYMVRHSTQLPVTAVTVAKAEGIPSDYLAKIFQQLAKAGFVKAIRGRKRGYVFAKPPERITLLDLFETIEGDSLFDDCFLRHCSCGGTPDNCRIFSIWTESREAWPYELHDGYIDLNKWIEMEIHPLVFDAAMDDTIENLMESGLGEMFTSMLASMGDDELGRKPGLN